MNGNDDIPGYLYGDSRLTASPISDEELYELKIAARLTEDDMRYLRLAGEVLRDQTADIVHLWRVQIIASIPHLAKHARSLDGAALPQYLERSNHRFEQWILDTCLRPYDRAWLDYQYEIALRHTVEKKNRTDGSNSTRHIPLKDVISFIPVINETIKVFLGKKGHSAQDIEFMHRAWQKSIQIQMAIWTEAYANIQRGNSEGA
jgi:hypothetical protein